MCRAGPLDLNVLVPAWLVMEPPHGLRFATAPKGIYADFAHDVGGSDKTGVYRVGPTDLNVLIALTGHDAGNSLAQDILWFSGIGPGGVQTAEIFLENGAQGLVY
ncbi:MAG: hypothetical protein JSU70_00980 [Phycisphaerales bacterium]|nr:MAG: hypothetical protein JSU70_00980 [Phycisphaerales bacterium]